MEIDNNKPRAEKPPKWWRIDGKMAEDKGGYFLTEDNKKLPIVYVWENGTSIGLDADD